MSSIYIHGPDDVRMPLCSRDELFTDPVWRIQLKLWQGREVHSHCCGGRHRLTVFQESDTRRLSLRAYPGTRDHHGSECPAVGAPCVTLESESSHSDFTSRANRALDRAYLRAWLSQEKPNELPFAVLHEYLVDTPVATNNSRIAIIDRSASPQVLDREHFGFPVLEFSDQEEHPLESHWAASRNGIPVSGRTEIGNQPIDSDFLVLAELSPQDALEFRQLQRAHCWPIVRSSQSVHIVQSAVEAEYATLLSAQSVRYLKPPSVPFLRLLADAGVSLSELAQLCCDHRVWPDFMIPSGPIGTLVEVLGMTEREYLVGSLQKLDLYRRLARERHLRWCAVIPNEAGGFYQIAASDDFDPNFV